MIRFFLLAVLASALLPAAASACDGLLSRVASRAVSAVADRPRLFRPLARFAATERTTTTTVTRTSSTRTAAPAVIVVVPVAKVKAMPAPAQAPAVKVAPAAKK